MKHGQACISDRSIFNTTRITPLRTTGRVDIRLGFVSVVELIGLRLLLGLLFLYFLLVRLCVIFPVRILSAVQHGAAGVLAATGRLGGGQPRRGGGPVALGEVIPLSFDVLAHAGQRDAAGTRTTRIL